MNTLMDMKENRVPVYIIENHSFYLQLILELKRQIEEKQEGIFSLFEGEKELNLSKNILLITDLFQLNFHNKKIVSAIFSRLKENSLQEVNYLERLQIEESLKMFLNKLILDFPYPLVMDEHLEYEDLFRIFHIQVDENYENYLEKIIDYLNIFYSLRLMRCAIFINLKTILSKEECQKLYTECFYKKIPIILFESRQAEYILQEEETVIIDSDLCEFFNEN